MSKISLKHSGGNVVSLNSPTSAPTSADVAFKLPNADGTSGQAIVTDASGNLSFAGTGKILQIVQIVKTDTQSTTSATFGDVTGLSQAITTSAGSKVFCLGNLFFGASAAYSTWFRLVRVDVDGSTNYPYLGDADSTVTRASAGGYNNSYNYGASNSSFNFLDTPSGAGSHTYKIQWKAGYSGGYTSYIGRDYQGSTDASRGRVPSSLTLIEVAA
tara:strand:+ start:143 stop:787 length:645 start_codon:yes stop_codon:yes gene_type:complete